HPSQTAATCRRSGRLGASSRFSTLSPIRSSLQRRFTVDDRTSSEAGQADDSLRRRSCTEVIHRLSKARDEFGAADSPSDARLPEELGGAEEDAAKEALTYRAG